MWVDSIVQQYIDLKERALSACDYQTSLRALNQLVKHLKIFDHCHVAPLLEAIEKSPDDSQELVDQFLWINSSLGNWSFVLRALELKGKLQQSKASRWWLDLQFSKPFPLDNWKLMFKIEATLKFHIFPQTNCQ